MRELSRCTLAVVAAGWLLVAASPARAATGMSHAWITTKAKVTLLTTSAATRSISEVLDEDLTTAVKQALAQRGELTGVDVDVKNGVARLTGTVDSEQQRSTASITAGATPGIRAVVDELRIDTAGPE